MVTVMVVMTLPTAVDVLVIADELIEDDGGTVVAAGLASCRG